MPDEPFTVKDLEQACQDMKAGLDFFPDETLWPSVMLLLRTLCPHKRALKWLVSELLNRVGKWPNSAELRGLLCTRFNPPDGIDRWCTLPGYTAAEAEDKHLDEHKQLKDAQGYLGAESTEIVRQISQKLRKIS